MSSCTTCSGTRRPDVAAEAAIVVVLDWIEELRQLVPVD